MSLKSEYCECGCHGTEYPRIGQNQLYWYWPDTKKDVHLITTGHGMYNVVKKGTQVECAKYIHDQYNQWILAEVKRLNEMLIAISV